jgi:hypothetical protein
MGDESAAQPGTTAPGTSRRSRKGTACRKGNVAAAEVSTVKTGPTCPAITVDGGVEAFAPFAKPAGT